MALNIYHSHAFGSIMSLIETIDLRYVKEVSGCRTRGRRGFCGFAFRTAGVLNEERSEETLAPRDGKLQFAAATYNHCREMAGPRFRDPAKIPPSVTPAKW